jgi:hypothetical protein
MILQLHGGLGDEICCIPLYRELSKTEEVYVNCMYPEIAMASDYVKGVTTDEGFKLKWHDEFGSGYNLHLTEFFASQLGITLQDRSIGITLGKEDIGFANNMFDGLPRPIVLYNAYHGWRAKGALTLNVIVGLSKYIHTIGGCMMQIGNRPSYIGVGYNAVGYTGSLMNTAAMLAQCDLYVGNDSGLTHLSEVGGTSLILYSSTDPACHVHSDKQHVVCNNECYGCFNRMANIGIVSDKCNYSNKFYCITYDSTSKVLEEATNILGGNNNDR